MIAYVMGNHNVEKFSYIENNHFFKRRTLVSFAFARLMIRVLIWQKKMKQVLEMCGLEIKEEASQEELLELLKQLWLHGERSPALAENKYVADDEASWATLLAASNDYAW